MRLRARLIRRAVESDGKYPASNEPASGKWHRLLNLILSIYHPPSLWSDSAEQASERRFVYEDEMISLMEN